MQAVWCISSDVCFLMQFISVKSATDWKCGIFSDYLNEGQT